MDSYLDYLLPLPLLLLRSDSVTKYGELNFSPLRQGEAEAEAEEEEDEEIKDVKKKKKKKQKKRKKMNKIYVCVHKSYYILLTLTTNYSMNHACIRIRVW